MKSKGKIKNRKTAVYFDEEKRLDYLTGFRKRKNQRREIAKAQEEQEIKEERKKIKLQYREQMKNYIGLTPQIEEAAAKLVNSSIKEFDNASVCIQQLDLVNSSQHLGLYNHYDAKKSSTDQILKDKNRINLKKALQQKSSKRNAFKKIIHRQQANNNRQKMQKGKKKNNRKKH